MNKRSYSRIIFWLIFFSFQFHSNLFTQQLPIYTQYREYYGYISPASLPVDYFRFTGGNSFLSIGGSHRSQWILSPFPSTRTSLFRVDFLHIPRNGKVSFLGGFHVIQDNVGKTTSYTGINLRGAAYLGHPSKNFLGVGFTFGRVNHSIEIPSTSQNSDPLLDANSSIYDVGVGIYGAFNIKNNLKLFGGLSIPQVGGFNLELESDGGVFPYKRIRHYYNVLGLYINTSKNRNDYSFVEISLWGKYVNNLQYHTDFSVRYQLPKTLWLGVGFSTSKDVHFEFGLLNIVKNNIKLGVGYDYSLNNLGHTFELNISSILDNI